MAGQLLGEHLVDELAEGISEAGVCFFFEESTEGQKVGFIERLGRWHGDVRFDSGSLPVRVGHRIEGASDRNESREEGREALKAAAGVGAAAGLFTHHNGAFELL
jgi:hypothetical protein